LTVRSFSPAEPNFREAELHEDDGVRELVTRIDTQIAVQEKKIQAAKKIIAKLRVARRHLGPSQVNEADHVSVGASSHGNSDQLAGTGAAGRKYREGSEADTVIKIARKAVAEAQRPLKRMEIVEAIEATGYKFKSSNPPLYVNKLIGSSPEFYRAEGGYALVEQPTSTSSRDG
jgi:hypothetical protein